MGIICKIKGHSWLYGKCRRCGIEHQNHEWVQSDNPIDKNSKHRYYCKICGASRKTAHEWVGCICSICGKERDQGHHWESVSSCEKICTYCQKRLTNHNYEKVPGQCLKRCSCCGAVIKLEHRFENGVCIECGADQNEYYMEKAISSRIQQEIWRAAMKITSAECLETVILKCQDYYSKLCCVGYIAKLGDDVALARIAQNKDLDYEIRLKARNSIHDESLSKSLDIGTDAVYEAMYNMDIKSGM